MDAATLYTVITLASGQDRTSVRRLPSLSICLRAAEDLRLHTPPGVKASYYCVKHKTVGRKR